MGSETQESAAATRVFLAQLVALMERKGITKADVAREMGCSEGNVAKLLQGDSNLNTLTMDKLARAVGVEVKIQLADPSRAAADLSLVEQRAHRTQAPEVKKPATGLPPAKPIPRRPQNRVDPNPAAQAASPEVSAAAPKSVPKGKRPVGRPRGPAEDYTPYFPVMARFLVRGVTKSETKAAELALEWGREQGLACVTPGTLQRHFSKDRDAYMARARAELAEERQEAAAKDAAASGANRGRGQASSVGRTGAAGGASGRPVSDPSVMGRILDRLHERFDVTKDVMGSVRAPGASEELGKVVAERAGLDASRPIGGPDRAQLAAMRSIPREVWSRSAQLQRVLTVKDVMGRSSAEPIAPEGLSELLDQNKDVMKIIRENVSLLGQLSFLGRY